MNISIITQYSFIVVAIGTMLLAMATGIVGTISILKGQSLIGDAVGHASLPGIILAFMISGRKSSLILMLGAIVAGIVAFFTDTDYFGRLKDRSGHRNGCHFICNVRYGYGIKKLYTG